MYSPVTLFSFLGLSYNITDLTFTQVQVINHLSLLHSFFFYHHERIVGFRLRLSLLLVHKNFHMKRSASVFIN